MQGGVVQLCLNPAFRRQYGSVRDAIAYFAANPNQSTHIEECLIEHLPNKSQNLLRE
jgi:hypothetical protein